MGKKCIVEMKEGERLYKTKLNALNEPVIREITCEPYTEPDTEAAYAHGYSNAEIKYRAEVKEAYQKGLSDAWDAARNVVALSTVDRRKVFCSEYMYSILEKHTAAEAIEKIRQYEQEKEEPKKEQSVTAEGVMRQYLDTFCSKCRGCGACILNTPDFTCGRGYHFLTGNRVSDEEVRRAYAKVLQKMREE